MGIKNYPNPKTQTTSTENDLSEKLGINVSNNKSNNSGTLTFEYKGLDQLDKIN